MTLGLYKLFNRILTTSIVFIYLYEPSLEKSKNKLYEWITGLNCHSLCTCERNMK